MSRMQQQLQRWWQSLQKREQQLVLGAGVTLALAAFYWLLWAPLHLNYQSQQVQLQQVSQQLLQVSNFPVVSTQTKVQGSLTDIISSSARTHKIQVSRMQPQNDQMQVMLNDISFDQLLTWLHALQYQHNVSIVQLDLAVADAPGMVRVRRLLVES
ncbi:type II secretion system protein M [Rheinheimera soli]|jgi:general secretion pathway protein M|uniref:General secretion pathway protein M n=1 Tax=Rheinheimera soli TaxID=443616 RepID=A0ABU1W155_9GAMM|nr:type II secretion system protein M [Rheinheimera soli]MDR7121701.1 general secretion pathway protein M [Rheinheimera soli]